MLLYYVVVVMVMVVVVVVGVRTYVADACWADPSGLNTTTFVVSPHTAAATEHLKVCRPTMRYFKI